MQKETTPQLTPKQAHDVKMQVKRNLRAHAYQRNHNPHEYVRANLGRNHPDYGMSLFDHLKEKALRQKINSE